MMKRLRLTTVWLLALAIALPWLPGPKADAADALSVTAMTGTAISVAQATELVNTIVGTGIAVSNITATGVGVAFGKFSGGANIIGFDSGIILSTGKAADVVGPNNVTNKSTNNGKSGDNDLKALAGMNTFDAAVIEFDFIPQNSKISFQYVFASEEYNEYANESVNDTFAFFVNGSNQALIPVILTPVSINTVNGGNPLGTNAKNSEYFINNEDKHLNTQADGLTIVMSVSVAVNAGVTNHIKLAIADGGDNSYDSNVFIKAGSMNDREAQPGVIDIESKDPPDGDGKVNINVKRKEGTDGTVSFDWKAVDDNGQTVDSGTLTFPDGVDDIDILVPSATKTIILSNPKGGATIDPDSTNVNLADIPVTGSSTPDPSSPPGTDKIAANASTDTVTVQDVPAGATVTVYDSAGTPIGTATNTGTESGPVTVTIAGGLSNGQNVDVTITESGKTESSSVSVTAASDVSVAPSSDKITANATTDTVTVQDVPAGATVTVYDSAGTPIGTATNTGTESGPVTVTIAGGLSNGQNVDVTITESGKTESSSVSVTAASDVSAAPSSDKITANATTDTVTVQDVPAGATVTVYDSAGTPIGTATNTGTESGPVTVTIAGGLSNGQNVDVTITESGKTESSSVSVTAASDVSAAPSSDKITANATTDTVTVQDVPAGATVTVYDNTGTQIGTATNTGTEPGPVTVTIADGLSKNETVKVTVTEENKDESSTVDVTTISEVSAAPSSDKIVANATMDTVTVQDVPAGATVTVYDSTGEEIGTATNTGTEPGPVMVTIADGLSKNETVKVTVTEENKDESSTVDVTTISEVSAAPSSDKIVANATMDTVTVQDVPAGATVTVYDNTGTQIGTATNTGTEPEPVTVTIADGLSKNETVKVTVTEENKDESSTVDVTTISEVSAAPSSDKIAANATTDTVTLQDVPAGATVTVYDNTGEEIGTATNTGTEPGPVTVTIADGLSKNETVKVTVTEENKDESSTIDVTTISEVSAAPSSDKITANATTDTVTVQDVPAGATVTVYDGEGNEIGTATNMGTSADSVTVTITDGLSKNETVKVTVTEENKDESSTVDVTTISEVSAAPSSDKITANATTDTVTVQDVPAGATVTVYDGEGNEIGTATNTGTEPGPVTVTIADGLSKNETVKVTVTEENKDESSTVNAVAISEVSAAPSSDKIAANATTDTVTVQDVPAGATVTVYDNTGNEIGTATNTGTEPGPVTVTIADGLSKNETVKVTVTEENKDESSTVNVVAISEVSAAPSSDKIAANATTDTVTVQDVPAGATVTVYDNAGTPIGTATNTGTEPGPVTVTIADGLSKNETVKVTVTEENKDESSTVNAVAISEVSAAPSSDKIVANATTDIVTVQDVPAGATVTVYNSMGEEIGTATNTGTEADAVTVAITDGLSKNETVKVTVTEENKDESSTVNAVAISEVSAAPSSDKIAANATTDTVTVQDVPAGATVTVYDNTGEEIGTATNTGTEPGPVTVTIADGLSKNETVKVTVTEENKDESSTVNVVAISEVSAAPSSDKIAANATTDTVTVQDVPAGATVTVYDNAGTPIGTATNTGTEPGPVTVTIADGLSKNETVKVTVTEENKDESSTVNAVAISEVSAAPSSDKIAANATTDTVTVQDVPAGATVTVYNSTGEEIGTATNTGPEPGPVTVTIADGLSKNDAVKVTVTEENKDESTATDATAIFEVSTAPSSDKIAANATTDTVTVQDVPAGATVTVYNSTGEEIGTATNTGPEPGPVTVTIADGLSKNDAVKVTVTEENKDESTATDATAIFEVSTAPSSDKIAANATTDIVTVQDVPAGATVTVYNSTGEEIGTATNTGTEPGPVTVTIADGLFKNETVKVTVTEENKDESTATDATAIFEVSTAPSSDKIAANATTDTVTVQDVPAGATVTVYDSTGEEIGTATNTGTSADSVTVTIAEGLSKNDAVKVTLTEENKDESAATDATAIHDRSASLAADRIVANATTDNVTVEDVPADAVITVYDSTGNKIGTATNTEATTDSVTVSIANGLTKNDTVKVTITEANKDESTETSATASDQSGRPADEKNKLEENVFDRTLIVDSVPAGTVIRVYDEEGNVIAEASNEGSSTATVTVTFDEDVLNKDDVIRVTFTEPGKLESEPYEKTVTITDDQYLDQEVRALSVGYTDGDTWESITSSIYVLSTGIYGSSVTWTSSKPSVIEIPGTGGAEIEGVVHRQLTGETVIVTASLDRGGKTRSRTFLLVVKAIGETKTEQADTRIVEVKDGNDSSAAVLPVTRITVSNGSTGTTSLIDKVVLAPNKAEEVVQNAAGNVATIYVDEPAGDAPDEVAVEIPTDSVALLTEQGFSLNIQTEHATLTLSAEVLRSLGDSLTDLYFRLVPIKDNAKIGEIKQAIPSSYEGLSVLPQGNSLEIETNYSNYETTLTIPFAKNGIQTANLDTSKLRIYIAHSDGTTEFVTGTLVEDGAGNATGIQFKIDRFSTFTIVYLQTLSSSGSSGAETVQAGTSASGKEGEVKLDVQRTRDSSGSVNDEVKVTSQQAQEIIDQAKVSGVGRVTVTIPDPKDEVTSTRVVLDRDAADKLADSKINLVFSTSGGEIILPSGSLTGGSGNIEITLTPVKNETQQKGWIERAASDASVKQLADGNTPSSAGRPVELGIGSLDSVSIVLPLDASLVPSESGARDDYLKSIVVFVEYKDGTTGTVTGTIVDLGNGRYGVQISAAKSGTYVVLSIAEHTETGSHSAYIKGYQDGMFRPNQSITRAELAALIARNLTGGSDANPTSYPDVKSAYWAAEYISQVTDAGLMKGDPQGNFLPEVNITRAEMAMLVARYLNLQVADGFADSQKFADVRNHWAASAIDAVSAANIMNGFEDGTFGAQKLLTRAEAVTIINRMLGRGPLYGVTAPMWKDVPAAYWAFKDIEEASRDHSYEIRPEGGEQLKP
ncbi:choice-of-anchor L domain-containing protein [Cohnella fermenti]|uniref:SLH domain-containing protein n=1 Tax=Cohnella fermenti TaxID=2565925 RepID=A0A4S4BS44_9BACL|nr:choice-of-anchor L domain-containing protein [Cohnella fermenti]THF77296.1 hypothetical protein E6C55_16665 [Cohnella fermenti]